MMLNLFFKLIGFHLIISSLQQEHGFVQSPPKLVNNYKGVALSGAEFSPGSGKTEGKDYIYPNTTQMDYYASKGFGLVRLPFDIARAYAIPYTQLNSVEMGYIKPVVDYVLSKGMHIILDPHNYGMIYDNRTGQNRLIGVDPEATNMFADFWSRMATVFKNYPNVIFALMNEPNKQTAAQWYEGAVPAIKDIRATGANQLILIPGTSWTGAWSWNASGNAAAWAGFNADPANNFAFEMHQYLDDTSGTHKECYVNSSHRLDVATAWLNENKFRGFLGEFAWTTDPSCDKEAPALLNHLSENSNVWMGWSYWCAGLWFPSDYMFLLDPLSFAPPIVDRPQMPLLLAHL
jgi:endoglucanase